MPALEWLFAPDGQKQRVPGESRDSEISQYHIPRSVRLGVLVLVLALTAVEAVRFQTIFRREGPKRGMFFDARIQTSLRCGGRTTVKTNLSYRWLLWPSVHARVLVCYRGRQAQVGICLPWGCRQTSVPADWRSCHQLGPKRELPKV